MESQARLKPDQQVSAVVTEKQKQVDDALIEATAMMHGVTSKAKSNVRLGPVLTTQVLVEVSALVDTGSPVTIVSLDCIVKIMAKKRRADQTPAEWRKEVEKRMEPPTLPLKSYEGNELNMVKQMEVTLTRSGFSVTAVIPIHLWTYSSGLMFSPVLVLL